MVRPLLRAEHLFFTRRTMETCVRDESAIVPSRCYGVRRIDTRICIPLCVSACVYPFYTRTWSTLHTRPRTSVSNVCPVRPSVCLPVSLYDTRAHAVVCNWLQVRVLHREIKKDQEYVFATRVSLHVRVRIDW